MEYGECLLLDYKAIIELDQQYLSSGEKWPVIFPGMQVVVEIHQGYRTVMEYLLSPVRTAWHDAARER